MFRHMALRLAFAIAAVGLSAAASAQTVEDFYKGRTITLIIPTSPGGIFNLSGQLVARHLGRFIPGDPKVVAKNMAAGGGLGIANAFATITPRDGPSSRSCSVPCRSSQSRVIQTPSSIRWHSIGSAASRLLPTTPP